MDIYDYDPLLDDTEAEFGIKILDSLDPARKFDGIILAVPYIYKEENGEISLCSLISVMNSHPVLIDIKGYLDTGKVLNSGSHYRTL